MNKPPKELSGLFAFKNITRAPFGRNGLVIRFSEDVSEIHQRHLLDAIHAWMMAQKLIMENGGVPPSREQIDARMRQLLTPTNKEVTSA